MQNELEKKRKPLSWLSEVIDVFSLGEDKKHLYTNAFKRADLERRLNGERSFIRTLRNQDLYDHANETRTVSYCGSYRGLTLLCLDADGDVEDCYRSLRMLCKKQFPDLWVQKSGRGAHGFLIVDSGKASVSYYKRQAIAFCKSLTEIVRDAGFTGVDKIEAKGLPADAWVQKNQRTERLEVRSYKAGVLGCLPRAIFDDFESVRKIPVLRLDEITEFAARHVPAKPQPNSEAAKRPVCGSGGGYLRISQELKDACRIFVERKFGDTIKCRTETGLRNGKGRLFGTEHLSIALLVQYLQTRYPNQSGPNGEPWAGTTPVRQSEAIWRFLYANNAVEKSWNPNIWTECKRLLTAVEAWIVVDGTYRIGTDAECGIAQKGGLNAEVVEFLESKAGFNASGSGVVVEKLRNEGEGKGEASLFITCFPPVPSLKPRRPHFGPLMMSLRLWKPPNPEEVDHLITHVTPPLALAA